MKNKISLLQEKSTEAFPITRMNWFFNNFDIIELDSFKEKGLLSMDDVWNIVINKLGCSEKSLDPTTKVYLTYASYNILFMWNWNIYKQIYRFDEDFFEYLSENTKKNTIINIENYLYKLPCSAFFIDNKFEDADGIKYRGCYVCIDRESEDLRLFFIQDDGESDFKWTNIPLFLGDGTVEDLLKQKNAINKAFMMARNGEDVVLDETDKDYHINPILLGLTQKICGCLDYLCADNKQVEYRTAKTKKEEYDLSRQKKDKVLLNDVGVRIGNTIRQNRIVYEKSEDCEHHTGSPKSPHLRSAHYHSFWTGKKDGSEERKLIVKFIEPIFIGSCNNIPTIHKVKR